MHTHTEFENLIIQFKTWNLKTRLLKLPRVKSRPVLQSFIFSATQSVAIRIIHPVIARGRAMLSSLLAYELTREGAGFGAYGTEYRWRSCPNFAP